MQINYFKKNKLPNKPGVYFFLKEKQILYIGKATSLKDRVKSYFGKNLVETRGPLLVDMLYKAEKVKWQETDSVLEALILEAQFIKKHQPYYNTREKDDKSFNYVCITKDKLPKVLVVRGKELKNYEGSFFGPYTNGSQLKTALQIIRKIFPFIDEASSKKANLEFYKQIHPTPANTEEYIRNIKNLKLFLQGKKKKIISNLKKEMISYAKNKEFEQAGEVKRQIFALKHINDIALMIMYYKHVFEKVGQAAYKSDKEKQTAVRLSHQKISRNWKFNNSRSTTSSISGISGNR
ncbi:MAG: Excinuclease ABC subunit C [Parcubacteria group bacterium GW2011_GWF1_40_5]|nr:MAG: Excinuclease ABC subunit C [Parcubacteria group bacterium GW2011_GWF1_40_5]